jgi:hypothetical protein
MSEILYVTSFNKKLYEATGHRMVESFTRAKIEGDLLITYEDDIKDLIPHADNFLYLKLEDYGFLQEWLEANKEIIPVEYGGLLEGCGCSKIPAKDHYYKDHIRRCPNLGFNRRASLWFRKVAALKHAYDLCNKEGSGYSKVVFIDSDVVFKSRISASYINMVFAKSGMFFHLGEHRKRIGTGIESGFIGFSKDNRGFEFLEILFDSFVSGDYLKYDRWDDGYVIRMIWEENPDIPAVDVVGPHPLKPFSHVVRYGAFAKYLEHEKGSHTRKYGVFKDSTRL